MQSTWNIQPHHRREVSEETPHAGPHLSKLYKIAGKGILYSLVSRSRINRVYELPFSTRFSVVFQREGGGLVDEVGLSDRAI